LKNKDIKEEEEAARATHVQLRLFNLHQEGYFEGRKS